MVIIHIISILEKLIKLCFLVMAAPLAYVRPELFDEAVDRHHRSYVSVVLGGPLDTIRCRTTRTLMLIHQHQQWIPKCIIHIYYLFLFVYNSNCVK
jgi:hypothetical protein